MSAEREYFVQETLRSALGSPPSIRRRVIEYLCWTYYCLTYPLRYMFSFEATVQYIRQMYIDYPIEQLKRNALNVIKRVRARYYYFRSRLREIEAQMEEIRSHLIIEFGESAISPFLSQLARFPGIMRVILERIQNGIRDLRRIAQQERLFEEEYYINMFLCGEYSRHHEQSSSSKKD